MTVERASGPAIRPLTVDDAAPAAALHAHTMPDPWGERAWAGFIADPLVVALGAESAGRLVGAVLIRAVAGEAEVLTIVVSDTRRRQGVGARLLSHGLEIASGRGAETAFLEVAVDNVAARKLYENAGFIEIGRRSGYYRRPEGAVDAIRMSRALQSRQAE